MHARRCSRVAAAAHAHQRADGALRASRRADPADPTGSGIRNCGRSTPAVHRPGLPGAHRGLAAYLRHLRRLLYTTSRTTSSVGFVVGLDYSNPTCRPTRVPALQDPSGDPQITSRADGASPTARGRSGGFQSLPRLTFPGGLLVGDTAGFLNVPQDQGNSTCR